MKHLIVNLVAFVIIGMGSAYLVQADAQAESVKTQTVKTEINDPECIYAEYRNSSGVCWGETTRLCEGSSDCDIEGDG